MRIRFLVVLLLSSFAGLLAGQVHPLNQQAPTSFSSIKLDGIRGWRFQCNSANVTVTQLGCYYPDSGTTTKEITLWNYTTQQVLAQATSTAGTGWRWATLSSSVTLQNGGQYIVGARSTTGHYYNNSVGSTSWTPTGTIQYIEMRYYNSPPSSSSFPTGVISNSQHGVVDIGYTTGPGLTVSAISAGAAQNVFANDTGPGGNGILAQRFTVASNSQTGASLNSVTVRSSGTGNDSNAYSGVELWFDADGSGTFSNTADTRVGSSATAFPSDNGDLTFTWGTPQSFPASTTRTYFIIAKLNGSTPAQPGHTFNYVVQDITVSGTNATKAGVPSGTMNGLVISTPVFSFTDASAATATTVYLGSSNNVCQTFTVAYPNGPNDKPASITVTGLGTANESTDLASVQLWHDSDNSGSFSATSDTQVSSGTYTLDNGTVVFSMASHANFQAGQTRRFFVIYNLNNAASDNETFRCYVSAAAAPTYGGTIAGLPSPSATGTAGLIVSANVLTATMNGPSAAATVNSNYQGPTGDGALLCDVTLAAAPGGAWTITSMTFNASGSGSHNAAYSEVAMYEDNGNNTWDGAGTDSLAAATATGFTANAVTMTLTNSALAAGTSRRFFLVGKLNGTATAGQTFNARLQGVNSTPPAGGVTVGLPGSASTALVIDVSSLTVANGPAVATPATHLAGSAASYVLARWRLSASNNNVDVNAITITTGGTGNWTSDVDATAGVAVWQDNGDGAFSAATDTLLYQGAGAGSVIATFTSTLSVANSGSQDLWVRVGLTSTAGSGVAAAPETFTLGIQNATDVSATGGVTVLLSTPAPNSVTLGAIEFNVANFVPIADLPAGGKPITITGSGLMSPLTVTIGGVVCPGTAVITGGTSVTGLFVPPGGGSNLAIVVTSASLPAQTLTQRFTYSNVGVIGGGGSGKGGGGGGCETGSSNAPWAMLMAAMAAAAAITIQRRKRA